MSTQPSPEAVALVDAALRAERALTVYVEHRGFRSSHAAYQTAVDTATETLLQRIAELEADRAQLAYLRETYAGADFADEQYPDAVVLKFVLPGDTRVSTDLAATLGAGAAA